MKLITTVIACFLVAGSAIYFSLDNDFQYISLARSFYILGLIGVVGFQKRLVDKLPFYFFVSLLIAINLIKVLDISHTLEILFTGFLFAITYGMLIQSAWKYTNIRDVRNVVAIYYFFVITINAVLVILHLYNLWGYLGNNILLYLSEIIFNVMIYLILILSLAYYLNSYSRKSMYFLLGTFGLVFSDILFSAYHFYGIRDSIVLFYTILSLFGYFFFFHYFFTKEESLMIDEDIIAELKELKELQKRRKS